MHGQKHRRFDLQHWKQQNGSIPGHLLLDLDAGCAADVPHDGDGQAPLPVGCRGHGDEGHRVRQRVDDGLVRALFQHGREDHLLITLSTATEKGGGVIACAGHKTRLNSHMRRLVHFILLNDSVKHVVENC